MYSADITFKNEDFVKSSFCKIGGWCVEVAFREGMVGVRDSKCPDRGVLMFTLAEWQAFLNGVKAGEFDFVLPVS